MPSNINRIYLAPGAYVHGGFITISASQSVQISGRGVLSGERFKFHDPNFTWALVNLDKGTSYS